MRFAHVTDEILGTRVKAYFEMSPMSSNLPIVCASLPLNLKTKTLLLNGEESCVLTYTEVDNELSNDINHKFIYGF